MTTPIVRGDGFGHDDGDGDSGTLLTLDRVSLEVPTSHGAVQLLHEVSLGLSHGESLAIVGESGSGKSMTLKTISRLLPRGARTTGTVELAGEQPATMTARQLRHFRQTRIATIFQDPRSAINPIQRIEAFMLEAVRDSGGDVRRARQEAVVLLTRMGIADAERRMGQYPFELSGGLLQRVMIASVLLARPQVILADEPTTALDVTTQSDVMSLTEELRREQGVAMLFVTHDLDLALAVCSRVVVLYAGRVLEVVEAAAVRTQARHPYTRALLASKPPLDVRVDPLPVIEGSPLSAVDVGHGCPFVERCPIRLAICEDVMPPETAHPGGTVRCHRADESIGLLPTSTGAVRP